ncbi:TolC family protein [Endozoicomonas sp. ONNA2]|uniref:TolC family protein n=1 Tax=Endozoicomonas sp. ONNA2 TaxID=2828741 RepID=UPI002148C001|nr:TolC family protein [Endozoicomonas sp. ONNA2]
MVFKYGILASLLAGSSVVWSMTLSEAIDLAVQSNPITRTLEADVGISETRLQQILGTRHPRISLRLEQGLSRPDGQGWGEISASKLELQQLLYDFWKTSHQIESARSRVDARQLLFSEGQQRLALLVSRAYLEILRLEQTLDLVAENIADYERLLDTMSQRESAGVSSYSQVQKVAALLENARREKIGFRADLDFAIEAFTLIVGESPGELEIPNMQGWTVANSLQSLLNMASTEYYGIQVKNHELSSAGAELKASSGNLYPVLSLEASLSGQHSQQTQNDWSTEQQVMVVLSYDLWDGSIARQQRRESELLLQRSQFQREEYLKNLERDVREHWRTLQRVKEEKATNKEYLEVSTEVVDLYRQEFELGQQSLLDISTAQQDLHRARIEDVRLHFAYYNIVLNLLLYQNAVIQQVRQG